VELQQFVTATLVQIVKGVEDAISELKASKAIVSPSSITSTNKAESFGYYEKGSYLPTVHLVNFDVAVNASESSSGSAKAGIRVIGMKGQLDATQGTESRIKFGVPIILPHGDD
jgi:hypothetical protein